MERSKVEKPVETREASAEVVGPYVLLAEIARGELSTVYVAKKNLAHGFQRLYALKRLKRGLAESLDHVELMLDEARVVSGIHHANIASVLDVGADAGCFVVMDYIEGETLDALLTRADQESDAQRDPRFIIPPLVDVLHALHTLHTAADDQGQPCLLVHEAPRARHILVGVDGAARLIDFSQVRGRSVRPSRARSERLKVAYMAPEQALSPEAVDLRADLFVVGITLWEALTGERLFAADTDERTFQNLLHRRIPRPSEVGARPPACFDAVCLRALKRDPKDRYASAQEMARALRDTALNQALYATPAEIGAWLRRLFGKELRERRRLTCNDVPSSGGILLDTPTGAFVMPVSARAPEGALRPGLNDASARPAAASPVDNNPYATGRIYGGSYARVSLADAGDNDSTPAFGTRRGLLAPEDDEPSGQRSLAPAVVARPALRPADERARAATLPVLGSAPESLAPPPTMSGLYGAASQLHQSPKSTPVDPDQTQPTLFVPARPGARRESTAPSPGAYSQTGRTRRPRPAAPSSSPGRTAASGAPPVGFDDENTARRPSLEPAAPVEPVRHSPSTPAAGAASLVSEARVKRPSRPSASPLFASVVTETPPTHVQRSDSSPVKRTIPEGPVGVPHRAFSPEQMPSAVGESEIGQSPQSQKASEEQRFAAAPADSLTPSTRAAEPEPPSSSDQGSPRRGIGLWLGSAGLAAIIMLAAGVGLREWAVKRQQTSLSETHSAPPGPPSPAPVVPMPVPVPDAVPAVLSEVAAAEALQAADAGAAVQPASAPTPASAAKLPVRRASGVMAGRAPAKPAVGAAVSKKLAPARQPLNDLPANPY